MNREYIIEKLSNIKNTIINTQKLIKYVDFCIENHNENLQIGENHHILSRTVFPEYIDLKVYTWNLSRLSPYNHYIAHSMLYDAIDNTTFAYAWYAMNNKNFIQEKQMPIELIGEELYTKLILNRNEMHSEFLKNKVFAKCLITGNRVRVTKEEFDNNDNLVGTTKGYTVEHLKNTISVIDQDGKIKRISKESEEYLTGNFVGSTKGRSVYKDKQGNFFSCFGDDPRVMSGELVGINKGKKSSKESIEKYKKSRKGQRPSAIKCVIFNEKNEPMYYSNGNFGEIKKKYGLPSKLYDTMKNNNTLDFITYYDSLYNNTKSRMKKYLKYHGWYVRKVKYIKITLSRRNKKEN